MGAQIPYDPLKDFAPIGLVVHSPWALVVNPNLPAKNVRELIAMAKAKPELLTYSTAGAGTMSHFAMELMQLLSGVKLTHLPYKGAAPAGIAVMSGEAHVSFLVMPVAQAQIRVNRLRGLGVAAKTRAPVIPQVPTMEEAGVKGHIALQWNGLFAPSATPRAIIDKLHRETVAALGNNEVRQRLADEGAEPVGSTPAEFAAFFRSEAAKWGDVAKRSGTRLD
jgi:tripartite-type tricarboxylate transporter receptor subunit TctC